MPKNRFGHSMGTDAATVYTCPLGKVAIITLLHVANKDGTNAADATVSWTDASNGNVEHPLIHTANIEAGAALSILERPLILKAGDTIRALASAVDDLELTGALILEDE